MSSVFLRIVPRRSGFVATSQLPDIIAIGSSPLAAAEMASSRCGPSLGKVDVLPALLIRVDRPGHSTIVMQPIDQPISLDLAGAKDLPRKSEAGSLLRDVLGHDDVRNGDPANVLRFDRVSPAP